MKKELDRLLLATQETHHPELAEDEITAVKRNLQTQNIEVSPSEVCLVFLNTHEHLTSSFKVHSIQIKSFWLPCGKTTLNQGN